MINSVNSTNTVAVSSNDAFTQAEAVIQFAYNTGSDNFDMMRAALASGQMTEAQRTSLVSMIIGNPSNGVSTFIPMIMQTGSIDMSQISNEQIIESVEKNPASSVSDLVRNYIQTGLLTNIDQNSLDSMMMSSFSSNFLCNANDLQNMLDFGNKHNVSVSPTVRGQVLENVASQAFPGPIPIFHSDLVPVLINNNNFNGNKLPNSVLGQAIDNLFDKYMSSNAVKELLDYSKTNQEPFTKDQINQMIDQAKKVNGPDLNSILNVLNQY